MRAHIHERKLAKQKTGLREANTESEGWSPVENCSRFVPNY